MTHRRAFLIAICLVTVGALFFRLPDLGNRPFHEDEAVHAFKFLDVWKHGIYRYDHNEFHGPTLYYAALPSIWLHGRQNFASCRESDFRLVIVLFGAGIVILCAPLASGLGKRAALCGGMFIAISPAFVFYSRYYIQEMLLAVFTLALIVCGWQYVLRKKPAWLAAAGVSAGLMIATKETAVLAFAAMAAAYVAATFWCSRFDAVAQPERRDADNRASVEGTDGQSDHAAPPDRQFAGVRPLLIVAAVAISVACLFLSGFLSNRTGPLGVLTGPIDYLRSYTPWLARARGASLHVYPWHYYLGILLWTKRENGPVYSEALIVGLGVVGAVVALWPRRGAGSEMLMAKAQRTVSPPYPQAGTRPASPGSPPDHLTRLSPHYPSSPGSPPYPPILGDASSEGSRRATPDLALPRFLAFYTVFLTVLYSAIPYKTPWCLLSFHTGWALLAGFGAVAILSAARSLPARIVLAALLVGGCVQLASQAYRASYQAFVDPRNPYVYSQPVPDVVNMSHWVWDVARYSGQGENMVVKVIWVDDFHWPIPWYLREFSNVGYYHDTSDPAAPLILASPEFEEELTKKLDKTHIMTKFFGIRPGVLAQAWVRTDVWEQYLKNRPRPKDED
jgi:uncharacterized protein (TIGR03663 family)